LRCRLRTALECGERFNGYNLDRRRRGTITCWYDDSTWPNQQRTGAMARESDLVAELRATVAALTDKNNHLESDLTSLRRDYASLEAVLDETGAMVMELQTMVWPFLIAAVPSRTHHHPLSHTSLLRITAHKSTAKSRPPTPR